MKLPFIDRVFVINRQPLKQDLQYIAVFPQIFCLLIFYRNDFFQIILIFFLAHVNNKMPRPLCMAGC